MYSINTNMGTLRAQDALQQNHRVLQTSLERLSTGVRINRAEDDAAGVMVRDRFNAQIFGFEEGIRNIQTAHGMIQVAEQGINKVTEVLQRMRSLAVRAADDNLNNDDRKRLQTEIQGLLREINERAESTSYNGKRLLDGSVAASRAERLGAATLKSNSILADGSDLISSVKVLGDGATTADAVAQGSYEVRIVHGGGAERARMTTSTTLKGKNGNAYLNSNDGTVGTTVRRSESLVDRSGEKHSVDFVFTATGRNTWSFTVQAQQGQGAWQEGINTSGTLTFDEYTGELGAVTVSGASATLKGSDKILQTIDDGSDAGQKWTVDLSHLRNIAHPPTIDAPTEPNNGVAGAVPTTLVTFQSQLDSSAALGFTTDVLGKSTWTDRAGNLHDVGFQFTKLQDEPGAGDQWSMRIVGIDGDAWAAHQQEIDDIILDFDASGALVAVNQDTTTSIDVRIADGTTNGQVVTLDMASLTSGTTVSPTGQVNHISADVDSDYDNGIDGQANQVTYTGNLDKDEAAGYTTTVGAGEWIDRMGNSHETSITWTKEATNTWSYTINGFDPDGEHWQSIDPTSDSLTGTATFDDAGTMVGMNGGATEDIVLRMRDGTTLPDGTIGYQEIVISMDVTVTQMTDGTIGDSTVSATANTVQNGSNVYPGITANASYSGVLDATSALGTTHVTSFNWYDRNGAAHDVTMMLEKTSENALNDAYSYTLSSAASGAWASGLNQTGTLSFDASGNLTSGLNVIINDGTTGMQTVAVSLSGLDNLRPVVAPGGTQDGTATPPDPTTSTSITGNLDRNLASSSSVLAATQQVFDRLGTAHNVGVTFTKSSENQWSYSISGLTAGGAWTGGVSSGNDTGYVTFNDAGAITSVNGGATSITLSVNDDVTATNQQITLSFAALTQTGDGTTNLSALDLTATQDGDGSTSGKTTAVTYGGQLSADADTNDTTATRMLNETFYDKNGAAHTVTLTLTKNTDNSGLGDVWNYSFASTASGLWTSGISGATTGATGTITFNGSGSTSDSTTLQVVDGTGTTQNVNISFASLTSVSLSDVGGSANGSSTPSAPTTLVDYTGTLDADSALTDAASTASFDLTWYDSTGDDHTVTLTMTKMTEGPDDSWLAHLALPSEGAWSGGMDIYTSVSFTSGSTSDSINVNVFGTNVTIDFSGITSSSATALSTPVGPNGSASAAGVTTTADWSGFLDHDAAVGTSVAKSQTWYDKVGDSHTVTATFTKASTNNWSYSLGGFTPADGAWTGGASGALTGTLVFDDDTRALVSPAPFNVTVNDSAGNQVVAVDFTGLSQPTNGSGTTSSAAFNVLNGSNTAPGITTDVDYDAHLDSNAGVGATATYSQDYFDRNGVAHSVTLTLNKATNQSGLNGRADTWNYTLSSPTAGVWGSGLSQAGTLDFNTDGTLASPLSISFEVADGTTGGQDILVDFSSILNDAGTAVALNGSQDGTATPPDPTTLVQYDGNLDPEELVGFTTTSATTAWYDRLGNAHNTSVTYVKTDTNKWTYSINSLPGSGGTWTGLSTTGAITGTLEFEDNGDLLYVNGLAPATFNITVDDDVAAPSSQQITIDFTSLRQDTDSTLDDTVVAETDDDALYTPTEHVTFGSRMVGGQGPVSFSLAPIVDRTGMDSVSGAQLNFYQRGDTNTWDYRLYVPMESGFTGEVTNSRGTVTFNDAGNIISGSSFTATLDDGTAEGQRITFALGRLHMSRASDLTGTSTDGVGKGKQGQIDAEIYFSGSFDDGPALILEDVGSASKTATIGGISFKVSQVDENDIGLTAYVKAVGYQGATTGDKSLTFETGADEGSVTRVGISRLDAASLFRALDDSYDFTRISLSSRLEAQDLIGQIDDALDFVGAENLKVGQFQNSFTRLLDLQRQQATSMAGAYANLNDADMAKEATNQSRRSILIQSGTAMVAQANSSSQYVMQLLR